MAQPVKRQKSKFGYRFGEIKARIKTVETIGGGTKDVVLLDHGMFVAEFNVNIINETTLELNNCFGTAPILIER